MVTATMVACQLSHRSEVSPLCLVSEERWSSLLSSSGSGLSSHSANNLAGVARARGGRRADRVAVPVWWPAAVPSIYMYLRPAGAARAGRGPAARRPASASPAGGGGQQAARAAGPRTIRADGTRPPRGRIATPRRRAPPRPCAPSDGAARRRAAGERPCVAVRCASLALRGRARVHRGPTATLPCAREERRGRQSLRQRLLPTRGSGRAEREGRGEGRGEEEGRRKGGGGRRGGGGEAERRASGTRGGEGKRRGRAR